MSAESDAAIMDRDTKSGKRPGRRSLKRLRVRYGVEKPSATGFTTNFAAGGLYVQANDVSPPGAILKMEIHAPDQTFALEGKVVWTKRPISRSARGAGGGMGVQILEPSPQWTAFCVAGPGKA